MPNWAPIAKSGTVDHRGHDSQLWLVCCSGSTAILNPDIARPDVFGDGHATHFESERAEDYPVITLSIESFPELLAVVDEHDIISEHVVGNFGANEPRVDHQRHFFEVPDEVSSVLNRLRGDFVALLVNQGENLLKRLLFQESASHLDELVCPGSVVLSGVLEKTLPEGDERNCAGNDDREIFEQSYIHLRLL